MPHHAYCGPRCRADDGRAAWLSITREIVHFVEHEDCNRQGRPWQVARRQRSLHGDGQSLCVRARVLHSCIRLGEGKSREERAGCASSLLPIGAALSIPGSSERLARATLQGVLGQDATWPKCAAQYRRNGAMSCQLDDIPLSIRRGMNYKSPDGR